MLPGDTVAVMWPLTCQGSLLAFSLYTYMQLGLPLGLEAPVMTPDVVFFLNFFSLYNSWAKLCQH